MDVTFIGPFSKFEEMPRQKNFTLRRLKGSAFILGLGPVELRKKKIRLSESPETTRVSVPYWSCERDKGSGGCGTKDLKRRKSDRRERVVLRPKSERSGVALHSRKWGRNDQRQFFTGLPN